MTGLVLNDHVVIMMCKCKNVYMLKCRNVSMV